MQSTREQRAVRTRTILAVMALAMMGWHTYASAAILTFSDKQAFLAQTEATSATGPLLNLGRLPSGTATVGNITFSVAPPRRSLHIGALNNPNVRNGDWTLLTPGPDIAINGVEDLNIDVASPVFALGFDFVEPSDADCYASCVDSTFTVVLLHGEKKVGVFTFNAPNDVRAFIGVWSDVPFTRVEIREGARDATATIDNEYFGEVFTSKNGLKIPTFEFALIGDLPYTSEQEAQFLNLRKDIDASKLAFVIHDGDFGPAGLCSDEVFEARLDLFQRFRHSFIFIFGDNDWTDCHRGDFDPLERLAKLRELFTVGDESLGQRTLVLTRQSDNQQYAKFRENVRWSYGDVTFVGLNVPGSNNNFGHTAEYVERNAANLVWLRESFAFAHAKGMRGILIVIHANPLFERSPGDPTRAGYNDFLTALEEETLAFGKPVVLVHGDTHYFRIDKPLPRSADSRRIEHFTRVETFGSPNVHWVRGSVDFTDPHLFHFKQAIVKENVVDHSP